MLGEVLFGNDITYIRVHEVWLYLPVVLDLLSLQIVGWSMSDPRSPRQVRHDLSELLTVAVCAVLCSADEFSDIEAWAKERIDWLRGFLLLEHGIPSHDTFGRVFAAINPHEFEAAFRRWVGQLIPALGEDAVVAIDGKTSRRSTTKAAASPLHLVSAFAADIGLALGQVATAEKSNEIAAIPELLATLALEGCVVTIDAMGTQTGIAKAIRDGGADYVLCVKDNLLRLNTSRKGSIKTKRMLAATSDTFRAELLGFMTWRCNCPGPNGPLRNWLIIVWLAPDDDNGVFQGNLRNKICLLH